MRKDQPSLLKVGITAGEASGHLVACNGEELKLGKPSI
jgi:hypothetical protein